MTVKQYAVERLCGSGGAVHVRSS
jgi:hypothetical protein